MLHQFRDRVVPELELVGSQFVNPGVAGSDPGRVSHLFHVLERVGNARGFERLGRREEYLALVRADHRPGFDVEPAPLAVAAHAPARVLALVVVRVVVQADNLVEIAPDVCDPGAEEAAVELAKDAGGTEGALRDVEVRLAPLRVHDVRAHLEQTGRGCGRRAGLRRERPGREDWRIGCRRGV